MGGEYQGLEMLKLLNHTVEKKKKLTLLDYNYRKDEGQFNMVDFPANEISVVKLYTHIEKHFMPHVSSNIGVDHFFCRHANDKVLKVSFVVVFE